MYRYRLNPRTGLWEIQLLTLGIFWRSITCHEDYPTLSDAQQGATRLGIDGEYDAWTNKGKPSLFTLTWRAA